MGQASIRVFLKIVIFISCAVVALCSFIILPPFKTLEQSELTRNLDRCQATLQSEAKNLSILTKDWAEWDDTYTFVQDGNNKYIDDNLEWSYLNIDLGLNSLYVISLDGQIIWGESSNAPPANFPQEALDLILPQGAIFQKILVGESVSGFFPSTEGYWLITANKIVKSIGDGPVKGIMVMGKFLSSDYFSKLSKQLHLDFSLRLPPKDEEIAVITSDPFRSKWQPLNSNKTQSFRQIDDLASSNSTWIEVTAPRDIYNQGLNTALSSGVVLIVIGMGFALLWSRITDKTTKLQNSSLQLIEQGKNLRKSEEKYRRFFTTMTHGWAYHKIITNDDNRPIDFIYLEANATFEKLTGLSKDAIIGKRVTEVLPGLEKDPFCWIERMGDVALTGNSITFEQYSEPLQYWYSVSVSCPQLGYFITVFDDITERKRAEEELRDEQFRLTEIIRGTGVGTWEWNVQSGKVICNERWAEIIGYTLNELTPLSAENWLNYMYPEDVPKSQALLDRHFNGERDFYECECRMKHKDGHLIWVMARGRVLSWTAAGDPLLMFGTHTDIEERKQLEEDRQTSEKLSTVGILAGGIAHDFNNILAGLYGNISLAKIKLAKTHPDFPGLRYLDSAEKSMDRATALTKQLLTFSKGGAPVKESLSIGRLVEEVVHFNLSGSNIKPIITQADNLWLAKADQGQIQQVFGNLTTNAKEAMPEGGQLHIGIGNVELAKETVLGLDEGRYILVTMADEGIGIAPEHLGRIFDPYFTTKQEGNGLGMATIYSIVNRHGGHIEVTSQLGKGTTFTLFLPAAELQELPLKQSVVEPEIQRQSAKILIMDDEDVIRSTITEMLEELSFTVETSVDGQQAIVLYQQALDAGEPFDLVILDLTIPGGVGGEEAAKKIQKIDPDARMIVSSGYADDPVMANYTEFGFKGIVSKPYNLNKLSAVLTRTLRG